MKELRTFTTSQTPELPLFRLMHSTDVRHLLGGQRAEFPSDHAPRHHLEGDSWSAMRLEEGIGKCIANQTSTSRAAKTPNSTLFAFEPNQTTNFWYLFFLALRGQERLQLLFLPPVLTKHGLFPSRYVGALPTVGEKRRLTQGVCCGRFAVLVIEVVEFVVNCVPILLLRSVISTTAAIPLPPQEALDDTPLLH